jgi:hypothetical protein
MEKIIHRLEAIHRALRTAPVQGRRDALVADSVALCLRDLHAIAAQISAGDAPARAHLRLVDCESPPAPPAPRKHADSPFRAYDQVVETPS